MAPPNQIPGEVTFSWKNYFKPTPKNLQYLATSLRAIFTACTGASIAIGGEWWVSVGILVIGHALDELIKFFSRVADDYEHQIVIRETETRTTVITESKPPPDEQADKS